MGRCGEVWRTCARSRSRHMESMKAAMAAPPVSNAVPMATGQELSCACSTSARYSGAPGMPRRYTRKTNSTKIPPPRTCGRNHSSTGDQGCSNVQHTGTCHKLPVSSEVVRRRTAMTFPLCVYKGKAETPLAALEPPVKTTAPLAPPLWGRLRRRSAICDNMFLPWLLRQGCRRGSEGWVPLQRCC